MTVTTNTNKVQALGNGATTNFPYAFRIYAATDLIVTVTDLATGVDSVKVLNTDYTVTGAGSYNGGNVVFPIAPASNTRVTIRREVSLTQGTDLRNQGAYYAETHEDVFDRLVMIDQQQQEVIGRSLTLPASSSGVSAELPSAQGSHVIGWDEEGTALRNYGATDNTLLAVQLAASSGAAMVGHDGTTVAEVLKNSIGKVISSIADLKATDKTKYTQACVTGYYASGDGGGGTYYLDAADTTSADNGGSVIVAADGGRWKLIHSGTINVRQFGAKGDAAADDTAAFQAAINVLFSDERMLTQGGGTVYVPAGNYKASTIRMKRGVSLVGDGQRASRIFTTTAAALIVADTPADPDGNQAGYTIEKLMLDGGGANPLAGGSRIGTIGIDASGMHHATVRDCLIQRFATAGVYSRGLVVDFNVERSFIIGNAIGADHRDGFATTIRYVGTQLVFNDTYGALFKDIPVASFLHTIIEKNYSTGLVIQGVSAITTIDHCYFEDNQSGNNLAIEGGPSTTVTNTYFTITANKGSGRSHVSVANVGGVSLIGNTFNGDATGNAGSADIVALEGTANNIFVSDNKHIGGFARTGGAGADARFCGDFYSIVRGATPGTEYQNAAGSALAKAVITSTMYEFRHASKFQWNDMAGTIGMQLDSTGLFLTGGSWNNRHLQLGGVHVWADGTGQIRRKFGAPTSDTDGVVVG